MMYATTKNVLKINPYQEKIFFEAWPANYPVRLTAAYWTYCPKINGKIIMYSLHMTSSCASLAEIKF